mgnify:CR=1 FL=1
MCDVDRDIKEYEREFNIISMGVYLFNIYYLFPVSLIMYYMGISIIDYEHQGEALLAGSSLGKIMGIIQGSLIMPVRLQR